MTDTPAPAITQQTLDALRAFYGEPIVRPNRCPVCAGPICWRGSAPNAGPYCCLSGHDIPVRPRDPAVLALIEGYEFIRPAWESQIATIGEMQDKYASLQAEHAALVARIRGIEVQTTDDWRDTTRIELEDVENAGWFGDDENWMPAFLADAASLAALKAEVGE